MAAKFQFPATMQYDNAVWHLVYAPDCGTTVMPSLEGARVLSVTCNPVRVNGRPTPIWLVMADIVYPARQDPSGKLIGERRMKGFRTYDAPPMRPGDVNPQDCAYYVAEPTGQEASAAQRFFDALIGQYQAQEEQAAKVDSSWCNTLAGVNNEQGSPVAEGGAERGIPDIAV